MICLTHDESMTLIRLLEKAGSVLNEVANDAASQDFPFQTQLFYRRKARELEQATVVVQGRIFTLTCQTPSERSHILRETNPLSHF